MITRCTTGEMMIAALARTIADGDLVFHGFGSPLVQLALHVAKRTRAPHMVLVAGATYGVDPTPPFLAPTSNDWVMDRGADCWLDIEELFDLAAAGRMGRMFLSGLQIDRWGNCNVTGLGRGAMTMKLPGGGGGANLSCDARRVTLWTAAHRAPPDASGRRRFRLVEACDFITNLGHRGADGTPRARYGHIGGGPDWLITELGVFDFDAEGHMRLTARYADVSVQEIVDNTGLPLRMADTIDIVAPPDRRTVEFIRALDPLNVHARELRAEDASRSFDLADATERERA
ncbi:CoA-transferase subunit beta [Methylocystis echinoides]|uniref:3-oxoadipate--succinyl-CoA transferase subunit B n=1 Tax=Methylocystis echinoides TaxID=29468 RepID=A0A9W6GUF6_9HYPH|nr:CoA-transferase [Methylocystis echinoides]GLI93060.1 3-oxoadipate--succinyl-CoA transferase subunit B [Methylocystis echinoides]